MFKYYSAVMPKNSSLRNLSDELINSFYDEFYENKFVCNSPSSLTYEFTKNDKECLYKFPMLGVNKNDIKIDFDPVNRTLSVTGKSTDAYTIDEEKKSTELKYKAVIAKQYYANEPSLCSLNQGYLYIKFDLDRQSKNVEFKIE
jgi:HSP20 family molecular chaperone IbpA